MARKGFSSSNKEKIIYDNTVFRGISATTDPNPEGYFKQLINFDISDTGQSLQPRKGFMNTSFHTCTTDGNGNITDYPYVDLNYDHTVYYQDHETGDYFFIDFSKFNETESNNTITYDTFIYKTDLTKVDEASKFFILTPIESFSMEAEAIETIIYLKDYMGNDYSDSTIQSIIPINSHKALYVKDNMLIDRNIIKVKYVTPGANQGETIDHVFWLEFKYNSTKNKMLLTVTNTDDTVDLLDRNIASDTSIIPDPIACVYDNNDDADRAGISYNRFPQIYKSKAGNYLINYTKDLNGLTIKPSYFLREPNEGYTWVYAYDILSTSNTVKDITNTNTVLNKYIKYQSPIYYLKADNANFNNFCIVKDIIRNIPYLSFLDMSAKLEDYFETDNIAANGQELFNANGYQIYYNFKNNQKLFGPAKLTNNKPIDNLTLDLKLSSNILSDYIIYIVPVEANTNSSGLTSKLYSSGGSDYYNSYYFEKDTNDNNYNRYIVNPYNILDHIFKSIEDAQGSYLPPVINIREFRSAVYEFCINNGLDNTAYDSFTIQEFIRIIESNKNNLRFYVIPISDIKYNITDSGAHIYNCPQTVLNTGVLIMNEPPITYETLYKNYLSKYDEDTFTETHTVIAKFWFTRFDYTIYKNVLQVYNMWFLHIKDTKQYDELLYNTKQNLEFLLEDFFSEAETGNPLLLNASQPIEDQLYMLDSHIVTIKNTYDASSGKTYYIYTTCTNNSISAISNYITYDEDNEEQTEEKRNFLYEQLLYNSITGDSISNTVNGTSNYRPQSSLGDYQLNMEHYKFNITNTFKYPIYYNQNVTSGGIKRSICTNIYPCFFNVNDLDESIFTNSNGVISFTYDSNNTVINKLKNMRYFENGFSLVLYLMQVPTASLIYSTFESHQDLTVTYNRDLAVASTTLFNSMQIILIDNEQIDSQESNIIDVALDSRTESPALIRQGNDWCVFYSGEGYRLVTWCNNNVYMSEAGTYYYFKEDNKKSYPERVVKVLPFKDMLLVFTTQNMYAIFPYEITEQVQDGVDDEGNPKYVQQKRIIYNTLPVLYNLYTDEKYKDVIQVYNGMILFYSADGQLYLISPSTQIDSDTAFTLKYINKAANDILLNYDQYINKRLSLYYNAPDFAPVSKTRDDIKITASVSISYIKIYYTVPKYTYTYILIYDITNNRYTVYDTATYGTIQSIIPTNMYDLVLSHNVTGHLSAVIPYTEPNVVNNNCDLTSIDNFIFIQHDIFTEIDTGIIYLNNQWKKRFRTLQTTYKNLDAHDIMFNLSVLVDDIYISSTMGDTLVLKNINSQDSDSLYYTTEMSSTASNLVQDVPIKNLVQDIPVNQLTPSEFLRNNTKLFDFSAYTSNKIITHYTNIPSLGKNIELQLRFNSKGKYKLQGFTLVYKEHGV